MIRSPLLLKEAHPPQRTFYEAAGQHAAYELEPMSFFRGREDLASLLVTPEGGDVAEPYSAKMVMDQIIERVIPVLEKGIHRVRLRLRPESLGNLELEISIKDRGVTSHLIAQTAEAKGLIEANLHRLLHALHEHGLHIEQFAISVGREPPWSDRWASDSPFDKYDGWEVEQGDTPAQQGEELSSPDMDYVFKPWNIEVVV